MATYTDPKTLPPDIRHKLLLMRVAFTAGNLSEAHHWLYAIACPGFTCLDPWAALEGRRCACGPHSVDGEPTPTLEALERALTQGKSEKP